MPALEESTLFQGWGLPVKNEDRSDAEVEELAYAAQESIQHLRGVASATGLSARSIHELDGPDGGVDRK